VVAERLILYALGMQRRFIQQFSGRLARWRVELGDLSSGRTVGSKLANT